MRGVQTPGNADHHLAPADRFQPLHESCDLNVVSLVTVLLEPRLIARDKREAFDCAFKTDVVARRFNRERDLAVFLTSRFEMDSIVVEGSHRRPFLNKKIQIDIGDDDLAFSCKPVAFG
jgi:hypothetical protein